MKKTGLICLLILFMVSLYPFRSSAIKIKIKGYGGIIESGGSTVVCPNKSKDLCAEISGSIWDLLNYWFGMPINSVPNCTVATLPGDAQCPNASLTVYLGIGTRVYPQVSLTVDHGSSATKLNSDEVESSDGSKFHFRILN